MPDIALAQTAGDTNEAIKNFAQIAASLVHIISAIAIIIIQFMPALWGSELITGPAVTEGLRDLWVYVRNLTNIAFVGMILFLAFSNLVTSGKGLSDWNIKSKLGPVILGLVAINFSLLAMRVLVDVVHVGTVALLSIADPVIEARGVNNMADYYSRTVDTETFVDCDASGGGGNCKPVHELVNDTFCASEEACLFKIKQVGEWRAQAEAMSNPEKRNIMLAFGTFFMGGLLNVLDSTMFSIIFGLAYLLALIAIFIVLLIRVVMMWLFIIFSPVLVTSWVFGFQLPLIGDQFWKYLLVPLKAAGALAFGFVMLATLETMTVPKEIYVSAIEPGPALKKFWGEEEFGGWAMIWKVLTVVLFWKVVFDFALADIQGVSEITNKIKGFGQAAGSAALTFGADQVKIPGLGVEGKETTLASFMGAGSLTNRLEAAKRSAINDKGSQFGSAFTGGGTEREGTTKLDKALGGASGSARKFADSLRNQTTTAAEFDAWFKANEQAARDKLKGVTDLNQGVVTGGTAEAIRAEIKRASGGATVFTGATTTTQPKTELTGSAKLEGTIKIDNGSGGTQDVALTSSIGAGSKINAASLASAGVTKSVVNGLTRGQLTELSTKIATQAGIPGKAKEIEAELAKI